MALPDELPGDPPSHVPHNLRLMQFSPGFELVLLSAASVRWSSHVPQLSVLAHEAVSAAVLHCGLTGAQEVCLHSRSVQHGDSQRSWSVCAQALFHSKPILAVPFFADQVCRCCLLPLLRRSRCRPPSSHVLFLLRAPLLLCMNVRLRWRTACSSSVQPLCSTRSFPVVPLLLLMTHTDCAAHLCVLVVNRTC